MFRYQNELPKKIKSRGKDAHLNHEELVQLMKWKQTVSQSCVLLLSGNDLTNCILVIVFVVCNNVYVLL